MESQLLTTCITYEDWFPGFVTCEFWDRLGNRHVILEKVAVIGCLEINAATPLPITILIPGTILQKIVENGKEWVLFSTAKPFQIYAESGECEFWVAGDLAH